MLVDSSEVVKHVHDVIQKCDFDTSTIATVRRRVEQELGIDLSDNTKVFIRQQIEFYLRFYYVDAQNSKNNKTIANAKKIGGAVFNPYALSPQLQKLTGEPKMIPSEVLDKIWAYIKEKDLQNPKNKWNILCDKTLYEIFLVKSIDMVHMCDVLSNHIWPVEEEEVTVETSGKKKRNKRVKEDEPKQKATKKSKGGPVSPVSDELAQFSGTGEHELSRLEVQKRTREYIKPNDLQVIHDSHGGDDIVTTPVTPHVSPISINLEGSSSQFPKASIPEASHTPAGLSDHHDSDSDEDMAYDDLPLLSDEERVQPFHPNWNFLNGTLLDNPDSVTQFLNFGPPPAERIIGRHMASRQLSDEYAQSLATNFVRGAEINRRMIWYEEAYRRASRRNEKLKSKLKTVVGDKLSLLQTLSSLKEDKLQSATQQSRLSKEIEMLRPEVKRLSSDNDALRGLVVELEKHKAEASSEHDRLSAAVDAANLEVHKSKTNANELSVRLKHQEKEISRLYEKEQLMSRENSRLLELLELSKVEVTKLMDERSGLLTRHDEVQVERDRLAHDRHWLISEGFQQVFEHVRDSKEWLTLVENISRESVAAGFQKGLIAGYQHAGDGVTAIRNTPHFLPLETVMNNLTEAYNTLRSSGHSLVDQISVSSHQPLDVIRSLIDNCEALAPPLS